MDKISNILPPSNRVRAQDISESQPARPGAPGFGRIQGRNSLGDRVTLSQKALESIATGEEPMQDTPATYKKPSEGLKQQVIAKLSQDFFNPKTTIRENDLTSSQEVLKSVDDTEELKTSL